MKAYPAETTEAFLDGHVSAFSFLGGVPRSILYDNTKLAVAKILGDGRRQRTRAFTELQSHYLFEDRFGRPGKGNDKGKVEGLVGYMRRLREAGGPGEFPVAGPVQNQRLLCAGGLRIPDVLVRGYVDVVVISCGSEVIARHPRSYDRDDFVYDPIHYLPLLERKPGALDRAAPLQGWELPDEFGTLRRLLESRMGRRGKREYVQVLRLLETFSQQEVHAAVRDAIRLGALSFDAVKHLVLCRLEGRPPRLGSGAVSLPAPGPGEHHVRRGLYDLAVGGERHERPVDAAIGASSEGAEAAQLPPEYGKLAAQCAAEGVDHPQYLLRLAELELIDRHQRMVERRIRAARFPAVKSLDTFDFPTIPSLKKALVLARCEYIQRRENVIAVGNSGTGKTHVALGLGRLPEGGVRGFHLRRGPGARVAGGQGRKTPAQPPAATVPPEPADHRRTGLRPTFQDGAELLFEVFSQHYERAPYW